MKIYSFHSKINLQFIVNWGNKWLNTSKTKPLTFNRLREPFFAFLILNSSKMTHWAFLGQLIPLSSGGKIILNHLLAHLLWTLVHCVVLDTFFQQNLLHIYRSAIHPFIDYCCQIDLVVVLCIYWFQKNYKVESVKLLVLTWHLGYSQFST